MPAILIIILNIGLAFFSEAEVREEIVSQAEQFIQPEAAEQVDEVLENLADISGGFWAILIGILVVLKSATAVFFIMQKGINSMWQLKLREDAPKTRVMLHRIVTLLMVIGLGIILVLNP